MGTHHQPHSARSCALWGRHEGAWGGRLLPGCGASGVGRCPTPDHSFYRAAAGAHYPLAVGAGGCGRGTCHQPHSARSCELALRAVGAARGCLGDSPPVGRPGTGLIVPAAGPCQGKSAGRAPRRTRSGPAWPANGQGGYITPAVSASPSASELATNSEVAHKWARWLHNPCCLGEPLRYRAGDKLRSGPQIGKVATKPLPSRGAPPLQSGGLNHKWPTNGQGGYITPAVSGSPSASERGTNSEVAHKWARWLHNHCRLGEPLRFRAGK